VDRDCVANLIERWRNGSSSSVALTVGVIPRCAGMSSKSSNTFLSRLSWALTAGWLRCSRAAALVTLCSTSNASRVTKRLRSRRFVSMRRMVAERFRDLKYVEQGVAWPCMARPGAFLMTPVIVKVPRAEQEFTLGKELANAAVAAGFEHVVFSSLENVEARTGGTKWAPHFTDQARVEEYIRSLPIRSSFVYLAFFYTNFLEYYVPQCANDGTIIFPIYLPPDVLMPFCDPLTAVGPAVLEQFDHPKQYGG